MCDDRAIICGRMQSAHWVTVEWRTGEITTSHSNVSHQGGLCGDHPVLVAHWRCPRGLECMGRGKIISLCLAGEHEGSCWCLEDEASRRCCEVAWCPEGIGGPQGIAWSRGLDLRSSSSIRFYLVLHFIKLLLKTKGYEP